MKVDEYGTGQLHTEIFATEDNCFLWRRRHLVGGTATAVAVGIRDAEFLDSSPHLAVGRPDGDTVVYTAPGSRSLARIIWPPAPAQLPPTAAMTTVGRALRDLNTCTTPLTAPGPPPALGRLSRWLRTGDGKDGAARLHQLCTDRMGPTQLRTLDDWCHAASAGTTGHVLLHGEPSLGLVVPGPDGHDTVLLTGESLCHGRPEHDMGWLLGELAEMADVAARHLPDGTTTPFAAMAEALSAGRDWTPDPVLLGRTATLRRMAHLVDFAGHVGWSDGITGYVDTLAALVGDDGRTVLSPLQ
ncbi:hypothetical protein [Streptomyces luteireticuli]|uniref:hypothetical protein n=1 Tax=Streptomyces luteireticuli TaxID=173858 RepID=UPI0035586C5C